MYLLFQSFVHLIQHLCLLYSFFSFHIFSYVSVCSFSRPILNNNVDGESPRLIPHSVLKLPDNLLWILTLLHVLDKAILVGEINLAGTPNSFIASTGQCCQMLV
jgi:hypothetical protein